MQRVHTHIRACITQEIFSSYAKRNTSKKHSRLDRWPLLAEFLPLGEKAVLPVLALALAQYSQNEPKDLQFIPFKIMQFV